MDAWHVERDRKWVTKSIKHRQEESVEHDNPQKESGVVIETQAGQIRQEGVEEASIVGKVPFIDAEKVKELIVSEEEVEIDIIEEKEASKVVIVAEEEVIPLWLNEAIHELKEVIIKIQAFFLVG